MKLFITGGTGLLGKAVGNRLTQEGHELYLLTRLTKENTDHIRYIQGDILHVKDWENHLAGMDVVIHMAAPVTFWGPWSLYQEGIIDTTRNVLEASKKHGIKRFIYISSESVLQDKGSLKAANESTAYPSEPNSYYSKSKMLAEKLLLADTSPIQKIIIRPTFIWGPGVPTLATLKEKIAKKQFMWIDKVEVTIDMVHADNVAELIDLTLTKGQDKDIFFVTDDQPKTAKVFLTDLLATQGITIPNNSIPNNSIPGKIAQPLTTVIEKLWKGLRLCSTPPMTRFDLAFIAQERSYDISKAKSIGYRPVKNYEEGLTTHAPPSTITLMTSLTCSTTAGYGFSSRWRYLSM